MVIIKYMYLGILLSPLMSWGELTPCQAKALKRAQELHLKYPEAILAVWKMESGFRKEVPDREEPNGTVSYGPFQINSIHNLSPDDARDFDKSLDWAILYLKKFESRGRFGMIKKYNGSGPMAEEYARKAEQWIIENKLY